MLNIYISITIVIVIILLVLYLILTHNKLTKLENEIKKEYSNIDINLKKRSDLIPNLVDVIKKYMEHEKNLLKKLVETRNNLIEAKTEQEVISYDQELTTTLKSILLIAENYPDLKASSNFLQLHQELSNVEESLSTTRKEYNKSILNYNNKYELFPNKLIAPILGFKKYEYFEIKDDKKEKPEINFD